MFETELFKKCRALSRTVWTHTQGWSRLAQDTLGKQWIRSTDSIGANLVEGDGRGTDQDALRFFVIARGSLQECRYWLLLAGDRDLLTPALQAQIELNVTEISRLLNAFIEYRKRAIGNSRVHETRSPYHSSSFLLLDMGTEPSNADSAIEPSSPEPLSL